MPLTNGQKAYNLSNMEAMMLNPQRREVDNLSEEIQRKRKALGLSQQDFAEFIGLHKNGQQTVADWESGKRRPTYSQRKTITNICNVAPYKDDRKSYDFTFIDLFAGIGGIRLPFQQCGGKCVFSSEWDKFSKKTYAANFGEMPHGDITQIKSSDIPQHDLLLAGFPCQAFSQAGLKRGFMDTRGTMFFEIQRILAYHQPKAFLLENVKQLKGHDRGNTLGTILSILRGEDVPNIPEDVPISEEIRQSLSTQLCYDVDFRVLKASNFGVPQNRERVYIIGFHREKVSNDEKISLSKQILDLLAERWSETRLGDVLECSNSLDPKYTISDRLWAGHLRRRREHKERGNGFGYSLFNADSVACNTISARYYKDGSEVLIDQTLLSRNPRKLTPRECARIQGFPDQFNLTAVSDVQNYRQFGNSVAMPVIEAIAKEMQRYLKWS